MQKKTIHESKGPWSHVLKPEESLWWERPVKAVGFEPAMKE